MVLASYIGRLVSNYLDQNGRTACMLSCLIPGHLFSANIDATIETCNARVANTFQWNDRAWRTVLQLNNEWINETPVTASHRREITFAVPGCTSGNLQAWWQISMGSGGLRYESPNGNVNTLVTRYTSRTSLISFPSHAWHSHVNFAEEKII